jgi:hypothetical protein
LCDSTDFIKPFPTSDILLKDEKELLGKKKENNPPLSLSTNTFWSRN